MTHHRCRWPRLSLLLALVIFLAPGVVPAAARPQGRGLVQTEPVTSHPRLWLTAGDLPRLRAWATDANPLWRDGVAPLAEEMTADMDTGRVPGEDSGSDAWEEFPTESYAAFFAFLSLVHPEATAREDYAQRARTLLMFIMNEAVKGPAEGEPFRTPGFAGQDEDRARWWGEGFALTVDWIYPVLTAEDKATIRAVFLRWAEEITTTGYHGPGYEDPALIGVVNDPILLADRTAVRWAGNNYFTAHLRNQGLMAMALDPADDPGGDLGAYLEVATGAYLYMTDHLFRTDAAGGLAPEGFEYSPQSVGYVVQFLLALHTAGQDDPARWGPQVVLTDNPFWDAVVPAYLHSLSPIPTLVPGMEYIGPVYQPAWYGDGQTYWAPDFIEVFGPLGRYDDLTGNDARLEAIRWIQTHLPPGGAEALIPERVARADGNSLTRAILYFLLFDPEVPPAPDPRPSFPLVHFAPGIGRLLARTGWDGEAAWLVYTLGWNAVDHQHGNGNGFDFYRNGEWLTKAVVGYGSNIGAPEETYHFSSSEYHNTLALENDPPQYNDPSEPRHHLWLRGSQWPYEPAGDPTILAISTAPGYVYALGDATNLYNSSYEGMLDVTTATRSLVWLAPDVIVVYDRAASTTDNRFKRFWLNLPAAATVAGNVTTMTSPGGQQLIITSLLPAEATPVVAPLDVRVEDLAVGEPMRYRLLVEAPGGPRETRFLTVLQGADAGAAAAAVTSLASADGTFAGTVVGTTAVLFPVDLGGTVTELRYVVPAGTTAHLITGLTPGGRYDLVTAAGPEGVTVTLTAGSTYQADEGGVLLAGDLPALLGEPALAFTATPAPTATAPATEPDSDGDEPAATEPVTEATTAVEPGPTAIPATPAIEGGPAASGAGQIAYNLIDGPLFLVEARAGATPRDVSQALDALGQPGLDEWVTLSPDGEALLISTERFDPACAGWACLAILPADLSTWELPRVAGEVVHANGYGAIAGDDLVIYPYGGGPHDQDLWAIRREGDGWSAPLLLTGDSPWRYHANPAIAPDGSRLLFDCADVPYGGDGTAICEVGVDGGAFRTVLTPADAPPGLPAGGALHHPVYAPDGGIVFEASWGSETLWRLPAGSMTAEPVGPSFNNDNAPCVLPDGRIASLWLERPGGRGLHEIKLMTPDGMSYAMLITGVDVEEIACAA